jgi:formylglycine-generating enzyme required for sulfatase activity
VNKVFARTHLFVNWIAAAIVLALLPRFDVCARPPIVIEGQQASNGGFKFSIQTTAGRSYPIAVSSDLRGWTQLTNAVGTGGLLWIEDQNVLNSPRRYYQVAPAPVPITNMVFITPGTFTMGSPASEPGREAKEGPQTVVKLTRGFWIGRFEVSQADCIALTGTNHSIFGFGGRLPLDFTKWTVATNYCQKLTETEAAAGRLPAGYRYRLPTEAEWEYACRAGTTTPVAIGSGTSLSSAQANFDGNFPYGGAQTGSFLGITTLPATFAPNAWGLYDMHGNVAEWCEDFYGPLPGGAVTDPKGPATGTTRVLRGGGYSSPGQSCRSARRDSRSPTLGNFATGFRVVLAADP